MPQSMVITLIIINVALYLIDGLLFPDDHVITANLLRDYPGDPFAPLAVVAVYYMRIRPFARADARHKPT